MTPARERTADREEAAEALAEVERLRAELSRLAPRLPERLEAGPEDAHRGLAQLVLTLVEFLRKVLEKQAVRRMEGGSLTDEEVERLGLTMMRLRDGMEDLKRAFGLDDQDLTLGAGLAEASAPSRGSQKPPESVGPAARERSGAIGRTT